MLDLIRRLFLAVLIEPLRHLLIARAVLDLRLEVVALHPFESKEHVIERTIEMIFANISRDQRATFVDRPSENGVTANANTRTARCFLRQIFARNVLVHISG